MLRTIKEKYELEKIEQIHIARSAGLVVWAPKVSK